MFKRYMLNKTINSAAAEGFTNEYSQKLHYIFFYFSLFEFNNQIIKAIMDSEVLKYRCLIDFVSGSSKSQR